MSTTQNLIYFKAASTYSTCVSYRTVVHIGEDPPHQKEIRHAVSRRSAAPLPSVAIILSHTLPTCGTAPGLGLPDPITNVLHPIPTAESHNRTLHRGIEVKISQLRESTRLGRPVSPYPTSYPHSARRFPRVSRVQVTQQSYEALSSVLGL